jgi:hypothetical protein
MMPRDGVLLFIRLQRGWRIDFWYQFCGDASPHPIIFLSATSTTIHAPRSLTILAALQQGIPKEESRYAPDALMSESAGLTSNRLHLTAAATGILKHHSRVPSAANTRWNGSFARKGFVFDNVKA